MYTSLEIHPSLLSSHWRSLVARAKINFLLVTKDRKKRKQTPSALGSHRVCVHNADYTQSNNKDTNECCKSVPADMFDFYTLHDRHLSVHW